MKAKKMNLLITTLLVLLYIPMSFLGCLGLMATDGVGPHNTPVANAWYYIIGYTLSFMFVFCTASILSSQRLFNRGRIAWSYVVRFAPIILLVIMFALDPIIMRL